MQKYLKRILVSIFLLLIFIFGNSCNAMELKERKYSSQYEEWLQLSEEERKNTVQPNKYTINITEENTPKQQFIAQMRLLSTENNSQFDLRDKIEIKVKNQENTSECWAFAMTTVLETNVALTKDKIVEYSPRHMDYATSLTFLDGINPIGHSREVGSGSIIGAGGNSYVALGYINRGSGPVLEKEMPFVNSEEKINLSEIQGKEVQLKVNDVTRFPNIYKEQENGTTKYTNGNNQEYTQTEIVNFRNAIKEHIKKYGGVLATTYARGKEYYSNPTNVLSSKAYYCDDSEAKADHQITIIGWDDNYAVTSFNEQHRPQKPGAYIVQNSYGKEMEDSQQEIVPVFDEGYIYISYEDVLIEQQIVGIGETTNIDYDNIYQYNPLGANVQLGVKEEKLYLANRFSKGNQTEYLKEISLEANAGEKYEVYINSIDGSLEDASKFQKIMTTEEIEKDGYYTIKLPNPVELRGNEFVVCLQKNQDANGSNYFWAEAKETILLQNFATASSNLNESFLSPDMTNWKDMKKITSVIGYSDLNLTIKAFTVNNINDDEVFEPELKLVSSKYKIDEENKICKISPNTTVNTFKDNVNAENIKYIVNSNGEIIEETGILGTGAIINLTEEIQYTLIVIGDVNGDGKITPTDVTKIKREIVGLEKLKNEYREAGDVNESKSITTTDLIKVKKVLIGMDSF